MVAGIIVLLLCLAFGFIVVYWFFRRRLPWFGPGPDPQKPDEDDDDDDQGGGKYSGLWIG